MRNVLALLVLVAVGIAGWGFVDAGDPLAGFRGAGDWLAARAGASSSSAPAVEVRWQYVDDTGTVRLVESLDDVPPAWRTRAGRIEMEVGGAARASARRGGTTGREVIVYETEGCSYCAKTKKWLDERGIRYRSVDIDHDPAAVERLFKLAGQAVSPSVEVDGKVVIGYDPAGLEELLGS